MKRTDPQIKIRLEPEVKRWVELQAKAKGRSQASQINHTLKEAMHNDRQPAS